MNGTVKSKTGDVRAGPGATFQVVATVKQGDKLNLTGRTSDSAWLQVCCYKNVPGWISASLVTPGGKVASLPLPPTTTPTVAASGAARAVAKQTVNLRAGPGTGYPTLGSAKAGQAFDIVGKNQGGTWWQICCVGTAKQKAWLSASLVTATGNSAAVQVARDIPTPAPQPTSQPAAPKPTNLPVQPTPPRIPESVYPALVPTGRPRQSDRA
jgi:N-acetylmuramoyl-L-alanine amidase